MRGKIIVIEGTDGSGKQTQAKLLKERLEQEGYTVYSTSFPNYQSDSSALVRMYLGGEFGENVSSVNPYAASSFFAVDRVASYLREWKTYLDNGTTVLLDRYTTSNAIYQASKMPESEQAAFCDWLFDFEYNLLKLPEPDDVIFLDMPPEYAESLMQKRVGEEDIHEKDKEYLKKCYNAATGLARKYSWHRIPCVKNQKIRTIDEIHAEIYKIISGVLAEGKQ